MILCTSITQSYLERSKPFFESAVKFIDCQKVCFTINFDCNIPGWHTLRVDYTPEWSPTNRDNYASLQHGLFIKHLECDAKEMILFCDSDMILQRQFPDIAYRNEICVTECSFPALKLHQAIDNIKGNPLAKQGVVNRDEFCAAWICMSAENWKLFYSHVERNIAYLSYFTHHAAWQVFINVIALNFSLCRLPDNICNAVWYEGTRAVQEGGMLMIHDQLRSNAPVYFNHNKFNKDGLE